MIKIFLIRIRLFFISALVLILNSCSESPQNDKGNLVEEDSVKVFSELLLVCNAI